MREFLKYIRPVFNRDVISECAGELKELKKLKMTYPPELEQDKVFSINLKA